MFGAPVAGEHHAIDASEAALEMQKAVGDYARDSKVDHAHDITIRVGLHSGEVVVSTVGEGDTVEYDASGPTVPMAARMEQAAEPGEIYLSATTRSLAEARIETEALGAVSVKGEPDTRIQALRKGEALLGKGTMGANFLYFYRYAMEACLQAGEWSEAERYAQALEEFTQEERLPWCVFFISRGRALAAVGRGDPQESATQELRRILENAIQMGYKPWVAALEDALSRR